jgi:hypothetical protein
MPIQRPLPILRRNPIKRITHIRPDILIPILIQTQRARRMLHEQVQQAYFIGFQLRQLRCDVLSYEIGAPGLRGEREGFLEPRHAAWERGGELRWEGSRAGQDGNGGLVE